MQQFCFPYELSLKSQLPQHAQALINAAEESADTALTSATGYHAGAALQLSDGSIITAAGQEHAAFPESKCICAARAVLGLHDTNSDRKVAAIAITYKAGKGHHHAPYAPCGHCRQSILEAQLHQSALVTVYMCSPDGEVIMVEDASCLLPFYFSGQSL